MEQPMAEFCSLYLSFVWALLPPLLFCVSEHTNDSLQTLNPLYCASALIALHIVSLEQQQQALKH